MSVKISTKSINSRRGFTLLEILLVVGIISILAGIVILAINPTKQLGDTRNAQRRSDVLTILNAIYQYAIDPDQQVSDLGLEEAANNTCTTGSTDAYDLEGTLAPTYVVTIPIDPTIGVADTSSGYFVHLNTDTGRVTVCSPLVADDGGAENSVVISVTR